jgi:hypothetical protein
MLAYTLSSHMHVCYHAKKAPGQQRQSQCFWLGVSFGFLNLAPLGVGFWREQANSVDSALNKLTKTTRRNTEDFVAFSGPLKSSF